MFGRIIYRLLIVIPVALSILLITLLLFYLLPGLHTLDSEQIRMGSDREITSLLREHEGKDIFAGNNGIFYFSVRPGYLPNSLYDVPLMFHRYFRNLSKEVHNPEVMDRYARWIRSELDLLQSQQPAVLKTQQLVQLMRAENRDNLRHLVESWHLPRSEWPDEWRQVLSSPAKDHLPLMKLDWHGMHNVFHQYLMALTFGDTVLRTHSGEPVQQKFGRTVWWTLAYTIPVLAVGWIFVFYFVLWNYDRPRLLKQVDRWSLVIYSFPTFVLASLALIFLTSHRYGPMSRLFPFPVFLDPGTMGFWDIYRQYGAQLILPMMLFAISPLLLFFRVFYEKIHEVSELHPSFRYLQHLGVSSKDFRLHYLSRYLQVATWAVLSNLFVSVLAGSLIIEWVFNIPGLGRFMYDSVVSYDVSSTVYLILIFTVVQQLGHILSDFMIDYFYSPAHPKTGLL